MNSSKKPTDMQKRESLEKPRKRAPGGGMKASDNIVSGTRYNVILDVDSEKILKTIGGGQLSLGAREAARRLKESGDVSEFSKERHDARLDSK